MRVSNLSWPIHICNFVHQLYKKHNLGLDQVKICSLPDSRSNTCVITQLQGQLQGSNGETEETSHAEERSNLLGVISQNKVDVSKIPDHASQVDNLVYNFEVSKS